MSRRRRRRRHLLQVDGDEATELARPQPGERKKPSPKNAVTEIRDLINLFVKTNTIINVKKPSIKTIKYFTFQT